MWNQGKLECLLLRLDRTHKNIASYQCKFQWRSACKISRMELMLTYAQSAWISATYIEQKRKRSSDVSRMLSSLFRTLSAVNHENIYKLLNNYGIETSPLEAANQDPSLCVALPWSEISPSLSCFVPISCTIIDICPFFQFFLPSFLYCFKMICWIWYLYDCVFLCTVKNWPWFDNKKHRVILVLFSIRICKCHGVKVKAHPKTGGKTFLDLSITNKSQTATAIVAMTADIS